MQYSTILLLSLHLFQWNIPGLCGYSLFTTIHIHYSLFIAHCSINTLQHVVLTIRFLSIVQILDIIAVRKDGLRGQAFILFEDVQAATSALKAEQGFTFFGKDLQLQYAKEKSDRIAKQDGTFTPKDRKKRPVPADDTIQQDEKKIKVQSNDGDSLAVHLQDPESLVTGTGKDAAAAIAAADVAIAVETKAEDEVAIAVPSSILFADSLPQGCNEMMLACLFRSYAGYKEVRIPREGLAFIEFDDEPHATVALQALNGFKLSAEETLKLKYGNS